MQIFKYKSLKLFLDQEVDKYNRHSFISNDPISIPHQFTLKQDIEITAFWTAILSWGRRQTIIKSANRLVEMMDNAPFDFIKNHREKDLIPFLSFKHRTFQPTDALYFISFFNEYYSKNETLEDAFVSQNTYDEHNTFKAINDFREQFFGLNVVPERTKKHVSSPLKNSTCKRLNMFLRWMVRKDDRGVDFGIWNKIQAKQLVIPLDVHVARVARKLNLLQRKQNDWKSVIELTEALKNMDANDPCKYDYALFSLGVLNKI